jgi:hypothetical protein
MARRMQEKITSKFIYLGMTVTNLNLMGKLKPD